MSAKRVKLTSLPIETPDGVFMALYSEKGLAGIDFPVARKTKTATEMKVTNQALRAWHSLTTRALKSTLAGRQAESLPPLDLSRGTQFQQSVWKALANIPCGSTVTYGGLATSVGKPQAFRAVGRACGANPIPVLVPCHRVLTANKKLGGFSGGLNWKKTLLSREGLIVQI